MMMRHLLVSMLPLLLLCLAVSAAGEPEGEENAALHLVPQHPLAELPVAQVTVDVKDDQGPLELWRHTVGHGGINSLPLPGRVVDGAARLHPRLIRIFIQEFFFIYPAHGRFDWSRLDPYMDSIAKTGAKVVAAITIKPKPLFPNIDQKVWQPNDVAEWQRVIAALVKRYSVDKPIVTYWEIGNETDIGENGGCPYLIADPEDYAKYYRMTIEPILKTYPHAHVGGPAVANAGGDYLPKFLDICRRDGLRLDFISWHLYADNPDQQAGLVAKYHKLLDGWPGRRPELMVTEWSKNFEPVSVEDAAFDPRRAAIVAVSILAMSDAGVDWSFYYHLWDQVCYWDDFQPFFENPNIMYHHWNEVPHRFGLFGVGQEVRPQYFVYQMMARMGDRRVRAHSDEKDLRVLAGRAGQRATALIVNFSATPQDRIATVTWTGLTRGPKLLTAYRIDRNHAWSGQKLELLPVERREVDVQEHFACQVVCPGDSVCQVVLEPMPKPVTRPGLQAVAPNKTH